MDFQTAVTLIEKAGAVKPDLPGFAWQVMQLSETCRTRFGAKRTPIAARVKEGSLCVIVYQYCPGNRCLPGSGTKRIPAKMFTFSLTDCVLMDHEGRRASDQVSDIVLAQELSWVEAARRLTTRLESIS